MAGLTRGGVCADLPGAQHGVDGAGGTGTDAFPRGFQQRRAMAAEVASGARAGQGAAVRTERQPILHADVADGPERRRGGELRCSAGPLCYVLAERRF